MVKGLAACPYEIESLWGQPRITLMRFESAAVVLSVQYAEPCSRFKQASICQPDRSMVPTLWSPDARSLVVTAAVVGV